MVTHMSTGKPKSFFDLTPAEKEAVAARLAKGTDYKDTRPLSARDKALWEAAKRGRGRPPKPAGTKVRRVNLTFDPALLAKMNAYARAKGISRAELVARGVELAMAK
jgi:hypothetical protein